MVSLRLFSMLKGLHQGDPLSPLLFVIGLEYLSCILRSAEGTFHFHPRCKTIKLSHLCFVKENVSSVRSLCNFLHLFSQAYGLQANSAKSAIHTTGVLSDIKAELRDLSRFTYGSFLLSILGFLYLPNVLAWLTVSRLWIKWHRGFELALLSICLTLLDFSLLIQC